MSVSSQRKLRAARVPDPPAPPEGVVARIPRLEIHCASCGWRSVCLPQALNFVELGQFDKLIGRERRLKQGQPLFVAGNAFRSLYALRSGAIRTTIVAEDGREQVAGYHIEGEIIGTDGIATTRHACTAVAAMDTEFCAMPFERLETLAQSVPGLQRNLYRLLSHELASHHERMLMLGSMDARERLAAFLLDLSDRLSTPRPLADCADASPVARGAGQLPRIEARDREPGLFPDAGRRHPAGAGP